MKAADIREKYLKFFESRGHARIEPAPIVPVNDPTTLFTGSGMQQLVPYLKGEPHPMGKRLVDAQPIFRAEDIEEVGDNRHTTFFEMLGNWSLGDYFKDEQIPWSWEFLTKELQLPQERLYISLFEGSRGVPRDKESLAIWKKLGVPESRIFWYDTKKNWWSRAGVPEEMPAGEIGGPTSEIFYEFEQVEHDSKYGKECHPNCDCGRFLEICNSVFMEYEKTSTGLKKLPARNVDFGGGLERLAAASQNTPDIFATDMFSSIVRTIELSSEKKYAGEFTQPIQIIADHLRAAVYMITQGLEPSNKLQGYILRRLLRRAAVHGRTLGGDIKNIFTESIPVVMQFYAEAGRILSYSLADTQRIVSEELDKFDRALNRGIKEIDKRQGKLNEAVAFDLFQSYGFPFEITRELVAEKGILLDQAKFNAIFMKHKKDSRTASAGMFKGGLADHSQAVTKLHTATHLLHAALRQILGKEVTQSGSNITANRLRFDYTFSRKPTDQELSQVEDLINEKIKENLPVHKIIEDKEKALAEGALAFFQEKYGDKVSVYTIGKDPQKGWFSKELCGGPHVNSTGEIGGVTIRDEENLGAGKRRIYVALKK